MKEKSDLKPKYGIVAMIDALGVRNATVEESVRFIENIQSILKDVPSFMKAYYYDEGLKSEKFEKTPPQLTTFGDTVIFSWEMKPEELADFLPDVGFFLSYVVTSGLEHKLAFRGAISVGNYIQSGAVVLGPVIADIAAWYDCAEMIGVFATPYCGHFLSKLHQARALSPMAFIQYDVSLKGNISKNRWAVSWPKIIGFTNNQGETDLQTYYTLIQNFSVPKGTEDKFFNTEKFVKLMLPPKPATKIHKQTKN